MFTMRPTFTLSSITKQKQKSVLFLTIIFFCLTSISSAQQRNKLIKVSNFTDIGYLEYLPNNYSNNTSKYPVMIFLHGVGERGNGTSDLHKVKENGPPKLIDEGHNMKFRVGGKDQSFIVISPQLRADYNSWPAFYVDLVVEHVKKTYRVDLDRIYLTGLSLGGGGCWTYINYKAEYAKKIAAVVPVAGHQAYNSSNVSNICSNKVATWAIHSKDDDRTPFQYSKDWVNSINGCSSGLAKLTTYNDLGHSATWERAYRTDHNYHNPNIYEWLLQQKRGSSISETPSPDDPADPPSSSSSGDCGCDHTITASQPYVNGESLGVRPGDVVCVKSGQYPYLNLFNFKGSSSAPITIKNCGGQVRIGNSSTNYGIVMNNNHHIRFTGTGHSGTKYGFKVDGGSKYLGSGFAIAGKSSNFEIDHLDITKVEAGVLAKTNPSCDASTWKGNYTMRNVKFHDFYIHGIKGEGFYIGHTSLKVTINCNGSTKQVEPHRIEGIGVYNNRIENAGWDGIQVAQASKDCRIYNNRIYNYGTANKSSQQAGIIVGGNTTGRVYNNWVKKGTGSGIQIFGTGTITIYNNIIKDAGEDAIFCDDRSPVAMKVRFVNNTIIKARDAGIRMYSDVTSGNVARNNLIVSGNGKYIVKLNGNVKLTESNNYKTSDINKVKFTNPSGEEYKLTSSSPVVNTGADASSYGVNDGYYGNSRPSGGKYDVGASEYAGSVTNQPPTVNAGSDKTIALPTNSVKLTASAFDPDGSIASYQWSKKSGPSASLSNAATKELTASNLVEGIYVFSITVKDNKGASKADDVKVTVNKSTSSGGNGLNYKYYEGNWSSVPNFSSLNPKKSGTVSNFKLAPRSRDEEFAFEFTGYIDIATSGTYTFYTSSDDGSLLHINGSKVVDNNGLHGKRERSGSKYLSKGKHAIKVSFFERRGGQVLEVRYKGPNISKRLIPNNVLYRNNSTREEWSSKGISDEEVAFRDDLEMEEEILFYPNPVLRKLNISVLGMKGEKVTLKVFGNNGALLHENKVTAVRETESFQLDMNQFASGSGLYYIVLETESGKRDIRKIIKQ